MSLDDPNFNMLAPLSVTETELISGIPDAENQIYDAGTTYLRDALVWRDGKVWRSAVDSNTGNTGNTPDGSTTEDSIVSQNLLTYSEAITPSTVLTEHAVDVPRFDHDPLTGARKGLFIEPAQTNLLVRNTAFENAAWAKSKASISADAITAPDGTLTADDFIENATSGEHFFDASLSVTLDQSYTFSTHIKDFSGNRDFWLRTAVAAGNLRAVVDVSAETVTGVGTSGQALHKLANGWMRVEVPTVATSTGTGIFRHQLINSGSVYTGDGTSGIYAWGAQLVTGPYAGSLIKTSATSATRAADLLEVKPAVVADVVGQAGAVVIEAVAYNVGGNTCIFNLSETASGTDDRIQCILNAAGQITCAAVVAGVVQDPVQAGPIDFGSVFRLAIAYEADRLAICLAGGTVDTSTSTTIQTDFVRFLLGRNRLNVENAAANYRTVGFIPRALSNAELQAITLDAAYGTAAYETRMALMAEATGGIHANFKDQTYAADGAVTSFSSLFDFTRASAGYASTNSTGWATEGVTIADSDITPPSGVTDVSLVTQSGTGEHYLEKALPCATGGKKRLTFRIRSDEDGEISIALPDMGVPLVSSRITFDIAGGVVSPQATASGIITHAFAEDLTAGWYRVGIDYTLPSGISDHLARVYVGAFGAYAADGSSVYITAAQIEPTYPLDVYTETTTANVTNTESIVAWTDLGNTDEGALAYNAGTTYALNDYAVYEGQLWQAAVAGESGNTPSAGSVKWTRIGATNRFKAFDEFLQDPASLTGGIPYVLEFADRVTSLAILRASGTSATITITDDTAGEVYSETFSLLDVSAVTNWYDYFYYQPVQNDTVIAENLPPYTGAGIAVTLNGDVTSVGQIIAGAPKRLGSVKTGTSVGIESYSIKDRDDFNRSIVVARPYSDTVSFDLAIDTQKVGWVKRQLALRDALETLFYMSDGGPYGAVAYGFYRDFDILHSTHVIADCVLEIEGLG